MTGLWLHRTGGHDALGHRFAVRCTDPVVGRHLEALLAPLASDGRPDDWYEVLTDDDHAQVWWRGSLAFDGGLGMLVPALQGHVNRSAVEASGARLALHASVAVRSGVTAAFPAPAESGKSTLVAGLVLAGWSYVTDEVASVDPATGVVAPYRKAVGIDQGSWPVVPSLEPVLADGAGALRGDQWQVPLPVGEVPGAIRLLAFPAYEAGGPTTLEPIGRAEAVTLLGASSFNLHALGESALHQLAAVATGANAYRLAIGDLDEAVLLLDDAVEALVVAT